MSELDFYSAKVQRIPRTNLHCFYFDNHCIVSLNYDASSRSTIGLVEERKKEGYKNIRIDERGEKVTNIRISANA